jgi:hypothetical protein
MLLPAITGFGDAILETVSSPPAAAPTMVFTVAVLFAEFGSLADDATDAVSVITVPFAVPLFTLTIKVNVAAVDPAMLLLPQVTCPVPLAGVMQVQPAGAAIDTRVVFAGIVATSVALSAALGPLLVTTCV